MKYGHVFIRHVAWHVYHDFGHVRHVSNVDTASPAACSYFLVSDFKIETEIDFEIKIDMELGLTHDS